jgi:hypothetical protein
VLLFWTTYSTAKDVLQMCYFKKMNKLAQRNKIYECIEQGDTV